MSACLTPDEYRVEADLGHSGGLLMEICLLLQAMKPVSHYTRLKLAEYFWHINKTEVMSYMNILASAILVEMLSS